MDCFSARYVVGTLAERLRDWERNRDEKQEEKMTTACIQASRQVTHRRRVWANSIVTLYELLTASVGARLFAPTRPVLHPNNDV